MILVEDPYYNEPAHEATRGTDTGQSSAAAYNANLTLNVRLHSRPSAQANNSALPPLPAPLSIPARALCRCRWPAPALGCCVRL